MSFPVNVKYLMRQAVERTRTRFTGGKWGEVGPTEGFQEMRLPPGLFATDSVRDHTPALEQNGDSTTSLCFSATHWVAERSLQTHRNLDRERLMIPGMVLRWSTHTCLGTWMHFEGSHTHVYLSLNGWFTPNLICEVGLRQTLSL